MWIDDLVLKKCHEPLFARVWTPEKPLVVGGNSNDLAVECDLAACARDGIETLKRYGGGGTVVLYPGCLILSFGAWVNQYYQNERYFQKLNGAVVSVLSGEWPTLSRIKQKGISDLCLHDKKFAGTSLFRSRNYLLYQASLICDLDIQLIEKYLVYPSKAPEYRRERSHRDFLFGLSEVEPIATAKRAAEIFQNNFVKAAKQVLADDLIPPEASQFQNLLHRAEGLR